MIVALFGYKHSGKSTVAAHLEDNYDFVRRPLAAPLKEMLRTMGLTEEQVYGDKKEKPCVLLGGKTPRYAMQTLGTEWGRSIDKDLWVRSWAATVPFDKSVVVDDLRFPNEALHLLGLGAYFLKVTRSLVRPSEDETLHESEAYVDRLPADHVFSNEGSFDTLLEQVSAWMVDTPHVTPGSGTNRAERFRKALHALQVQP